MDLATKPFSPHHDWIDRERLVRFCRHLTGTVTILVTHRFSTVRMADVIVVLERGQIVELGNHQQLVENNGLYAELYELQARAYR